MAAKTGTYTLIASTTVAGTSTTNVTFSSIPATYTDLVLVAQYKAVGNNYLMCRFNGDTGSNYSRTELRGDGSSATSQRLSNESYAYITSIYAAAGELGTFILNLNDYSNTTTFKTVISRGNNNSTGTGVNANLWRSTSAINTILVTPIGNGYDVGSTFKLYGIEAAK